MTGGSLRAHPAGTTLVAITRTDRQRLNIEITADPAALLAKLTALAAPAVPVAPSDPIPQIAAMAAMLVQHVRLAAEPAGTTIPVRVRDVRRTPDQAVLITLDAELPSSIPAVRWQATFIFGTYPVTFKDAGEPRAHWLDGAETSPPLALGSSGSDAFVTNIARRVALGYTHILPKGIDHIVFVLGLFLLSRRWGAVLLQVSAFTVAHSITLGLTLYGKVSLPASVVEPLIALSIAYVAIENLFTSEVKSWRVGLVFLFGLLHGMGFAEALANLQLPRGEFFSTLIAFNAGVEAGQLSVLMLAALLVWAARIQPADYRRQVARPASLGIAALGLFWTIARLSQG